MLGPCFPRVIGERIFAVGREKFDQLAALLVGEARAHADVLQRARIVEKPEQQRADQRALAFLVPAKARNHAIAVALVLHLEHHALVRLVGARDGLAMTPSRPAPSKRRNQSAAMLDSWSPA